MKKNECKTNDNSRTAIQNAYSCNTLGNNRIEITRSITNNGNIKINNNGNT